MTISHKDSGGTQETPKIGIIWPMLRKFVPPWRDPPLVEKNERMIEKEGKKNRKENEK